MLVHLLSLLGQYAASIGSTMCANWFLDEEETPKSLIR